jgi:hypothetical protein
MTSEFFISFLFFCFYTTRAAHRQVQHSNRQKKKSLFLITVLFLLLHYARRSVSTTTTLPEKIHFFVEMPFISHYLNPPCCFRYGFVFWLLQHGHRQDAVGCAVFERLRPCSCAAWSSARYDLHRPVYSRSCWHRWRYVHVYLSSYMVMFV